MRKIDLKRKFNVITCLFGSLDYCLSDDELKDTLKVVKKHLEDDGLFIFDFWPTFAFTKKNWQSIREIEKETNIVKIGIKCVVIKDKNLLDSFAEEHNLRVFSMPEIKRFLNENNFKCLGFFKVDWRAKKPYTTEKIDLETRNVACVATI